MSIQKIFTKKWPGFLNDTNFGPKQLSYLWKPKNGMAIFSQTESNLLLPKI